MLSYGDPSGFTSVIKINKYLNQEIASSLHVLSALVAALIVSMDCIRQFGIVLGIAVLSCALADKSQVSTVTFHDCHMIVSCCVQAVVRL